MLKYGLIVIIYFCSCVSSEKESIKEKRESVFKDSINKIQKEYSIDDTLTKSFRHTVEYYHFLNRNLLAIDLYPNDFLDLYIKDSIYYILYEVDRSIVCRLTSSKTEFELIRNFLNSDNYDQRLNFIYMIDSIKKADIYLKAEQGEYTAYVDRNPRRDFFFATGVLIKSIIVNPSTDLE